MDGRAAYVLRPQLPAAIHEGLYARRRTDCIGARDDFRVCRQIDPEAAEIGPAVHKGYGDVTEEIRIGAI